MTVGRHMLWPYVYGLRFALGALAAWCATVLNATNQPPSQTQREGDEK
jgi:hypothetical protein